jgi:hypothetical protein
MKMKTTRRTKRNIKKLNYEPKEILIKGERRAWWEQHCQEIDELNRQGSTIYMKTV